MVMHDSNLHTWEVEAEEDHEFKVIIHYITSLKPAQPA